MNTKKPAIVIRFVIGSQCFGFEDIFPINVINNKWKSKWKTNLRIDIEGFDLFYKKVWWDLHWLKKWPQIRIRNYPRPINLIWSMIRMRLHRHCTWYLSRPTSIVKNLRFRFLVAFFCIRYVVFRNCFKEIFKCEEKLVTYGHCCVQNSLITLNEPCPAFRSNKVLWK